MELKQTWRVLQNQKGEEKKREEERRRKLV
jgi:hypothetical protein